MDELVTGALQSNSQLLSQLWYISTINDLPSTTNVFLPVAYERLHCLVIGY